MTTRPRRRDPNTRTVVRPPERELAASILDLAAPLLERLGRAPAPEEARRAVVTIEAKMPTVVALFAEGRLTEVGGAPVEVAVGTRKTGRMVLAEVRCSGSFGHNDIAVLVFDPLGAS